MCLYLTILNDYYIYSYSLGESLEKYLNKIYNILERIPEDELVSKASRKLFSNGDLLFNKNGQSVEFNQYSNYTEGDSTRHIDWKQYSKTEKLYTKRFHSESNSNAIFIVDTTKSMNFKGHSKIDKFEYSILIFGVLSHILLLSNSKVSIVSKDNYSGFKRHISDFPLLLNSIKLESKFDILKKLSIIKEIQETRNSTIFLISDFMYEMNDLLKEVEEMRELNYDFYFIQVLTDSEINFDYKGIIKFKDMENSKTLITEPLTIKKIYLEELKVHNDRISKTLLKNNMRYKLIDMSNEIEFSILNLFGI